MGRRLRRGPAVATASPDGQPADRGSHDARRAPDHHLRPWPPGLALSVAALTCAVPGSPQPRPHRCGATDLAGSPVPAQKGAPLDPLSAAEIRAVFRVIRADSRFPNSGFVPAMSLLEPPKADVLAWQAGATLQPQGDPQRLRPRRQRGQRGGRRPAQPQRRVVDAAPRGRTGRLRHGVDRGRQHRPQGRPLAGGHRRPRAQAERHLHRRLGSRRHGGHR